MTACCISRNFFSKGSISVRLLKSSLQVPMCKFFLFNNNHLGLERGSKRFRHFPSINQSINGECLDESKTEKMKVKCMTRREERNLISDNARVEGTCSRKVVGFGFSYFFPSKIISRAPMNLEDKYTRCRVEFVFLSVLENISI